MPLKHIGFHGKTVVESKKMGGLQVLGTCFLVVIGFLGYPIFDLQRGKSFGFHPVLARLLRRKRAKPSIGTIKIEGLTEFRGSLSPP